MPQRSCGAKASWPAGKVLVFAHTSPFRTGLRWSNSLVVPLRQPTADMRLIAQAAVMGLKLMFQRSFILAMAGVLLLGLSSAGAL